ncbi:MAG: DNA repair protein RadC [Rubrobacteraceae bacterium]
MERANAYADAGAGAQEPLLLFEPVHATPASAGSAMRRRCADLGLALELHPRERLLDAGPESLSSAELLALLLGGEPGRALHSAGGVISRAGGLAGLRASSYHDLLHGSGLSEARAATVIAATELGKRMMSARGPKRPIISSPRDVDALLGVRMRDFDREHFVVLLLDTKNQVLGSPTVSVGTLCSSLVHPREVFKPAIKISAASVILAHNHPSGSIVPSAEDRQVTNRLAQAGKHIGIEILDHVIFGEGCLSMKERGML